MPRTTAIGDQIRDGSIQRVDLDAATPGAAVIRRLIAGTNVTLTQTGPDSGTGDVTVNATAGAGATFTALFGDGAAQTFVITHTLSTQNFIAEVSRAATPNDVVRCKIERTSTTTVTVRMLITPSTNQFRINMSAA
jgi:hypothetical protein